MRGYHIRVSIPSKSEKPYHHPSGTFIPKTLFQHLPSHSPKPTTRRNALFNPAHRDYRFGPIRVDWVDFENMSTGVYTGKEKESGRGPATAQFTPHARTKSGSTNLPEGTVHVFRDCTRRDDGKAATSYSSAPIATPVKSLSESENGVVLAVLAVPSWMTPSDFLGFVAPAAEGMAHLRIIRDSVPNRSLVIMNFRQAQEATEFIEAYNGKLFNSMDPETCHVVRVLSVQIDIEDYAFPSFGGSQSSMYELPTCPVCLERMDSAVTGLITVPCSHTFHCMCLSKWGDSRCPVCRYSQILLSSHPTSASNRSRPIPFTTSTTPDLSACVDCASTTNLWICLICGNIGCGRYRRAHAHAHYESTTHLYALELETQRVWDYAGDGYVHRLIQNKADGKLVELPSAASSVATNSRDDDNLGPSRADTLSAEKIEAIGIEYSYLLTSQLDSQRSYYEDQTKELKSQVDELRVMVEKLSKDTEKERAHAKEEGARRQREEEEKFDVIYKDKIKAEKRAEKVAELARKLDKELKEERAVSEGLMKNLGKMKQKVEEADKQKKEHDAKVVELEDQLRDVMFFLEAKTKIEQGGGAEAEAAGGSIGLPPSAPPSTTTSAKKKTRKG
ncbi:hypothetical protein SERLA73DRAFT_93073 [Serpula lacrymans var. lacrymans S7.3]|uniref:BRCA1-associated protein n=2 Tax=Serpula lacrymans var. lacrymans TaxID=341189 RepID=F8Q4V2_SERL3|nr:uncharacterized protein SERLADRAFT_451036 [Serpula lacrymans var. lacrymans S7.9]EGN96579.1 hypothetical protein SERLA73DRAFT_93073 [Serpula lacrymans var. lacrymans S7.3]EGO22151.1 hypothetical protein SERLADRAFT_451036 [Serpula lacrymans var. lacrymans S7.9]